MGNLTDIEYHIPEKGPLYNEILLRKQHLRLAAKSDVNGFSGIHYTKHHGSIIL